MLDIPIIAARAIARKLRKYAARRRSYRNALAHNKRHMYSGNPGRVGGTWCCPTCNTVHGCVAWNAFTGRQFPACCEFEAGPRQHKIHATGL